MSMSDFRFPVLEAVETDASVTGALANFHVSPKNVVAAAKEFFRKGWFLESISGLDMAEGFEVVYHYAHWQEPGKYVVRTVVPHDAPNLPTVSHIFGAADWHERETHDFYGIVFEGHPNLIPLLLPEDMEEHPLVKEEKKRKPATELFDWHMLAPAPSVREEEGGEAETAEESGK